MHQGRNKDQQDKDRGRGMHFSAYASVLFLCIILCGCTRREQLVLEADSESALNDIYAVQDPIDVSQSAGEQSAAPDEDMAETQGVQESIVTAQTDEPQTICVHVCGAVNHPDVYELPAGSRVYEAVKKAGGFTEDADDSYVNQAQILSDGVKLVIPTIEQTSGMSAEEECVSEIGIVDVQNGVIQDRNVQAQNERMGSGQEASDGKININTASEAELCNIPGIGAVRAAAIVAYRQEKGSFTSIEDIMNVSGIKEGTYAKIKDSIKVN